MTKAMTRAGTALQIVSLLASIATLILIAGPTPSTRTARADAIPIVTAPVLASTTTAPLEPDRLAHRIVQPSPVVRELPIPSCMWTPAARRNLTRMVRIESSSGRDLDAIAWTMARRWRAFGKHRRFSDYVIDSSPPMSAHRRHQPVTPYQAAMIRSRVEPDNELALRLDAWARGEVPDPCDGASVAWRAPYARIRSQPPVSCGDTSNRFYATRTEIRQLVEAMIAEPLPSCSPHTPQ